MPSYHSSSSTNKYVVGVPLHSKSLSVPLPGDLITFQFEQSCVFVKPAESYQEAVGIARKEFDELVHVPPDRLAFTLEDNSAGKRLIRISESAWTSVTAKLPRGAIINIIIRPDLDTRTPPPQYLDIPDQFFPQDSKKSRSGLGKEIERTPSRGSNYSTKSNSRRPFPWIGVGK
ncbi:hypothetical protein CVT26_001755 [Gymnopilus dilepis]|uniref:Uncharacterized protein n=1 Tax=Gymnopilus dilepis TaxID=231916 RepID=A0A409WE26_9AGAR|nr:hypothetical protein CVT26_001755 [Gymnopilus dilepis]